MSAWIASWESLCVHIPNFSPLRPSSAKRTKWLNAASERTANFHVISMTRHCALSRPSARRKSTATTLTSTDQAVNTTICAAMSARTTTRRAITATDSTRKSNVVIWHRMSSVRPLNSSSVRSCSRCLSYLMLRFQQTFERFKPNCPIGMTEK